MKLRLLLTLTALLVVALVPTHAGATPYWGPAKSTPI